MSNYYDKKAEQLKDKIFDALYESDDSEDTLTNHQRKVLKSILGFKDGHAQIHSPSNYNSIEECDLDTMETILNPRNTKRISGVFESDDLQTIAAANVIAANANMVVSNLDVTDEGHNIIVSSKNICNEKIGHGFFYDGNRIREFESNCATVVLKKNSGNSNLFNVQTVFAGQPGDINAQLPYLTVTDRDCRPIVRKTEYYKNASPEEQAYLDYIANPANETKIPYKAYLKKNSENDVFTLVRANKDGSKLKTFITKDGITATCTKIDKNGEHQKMNIPNMENHFGKKLDLTNEEIYNAFAEHYPKYAAVANKIYNMIQKNCNKQNEIKLENKSNIRELPYINDSSDDSLTIHKE